MPPLVIPGLHDRVAVLQPPATEQPATEPLDMSRITREAEAASRSQSTKKDFQPSES
jgi:hypothetical protein